MAVPPKAIIFDIGGVVLRSPFIAIAAYEREHGLPPNYLNCSISGRGSTGSWQRFERGELSLSDFYAGFSQDLSDAINGNVWYRAYCEKQGIECPSLPSTLSVDGRRLFGNMMQTASVYDEHFELAIARLRASRKFKLIALTNNFGKPKGGIPEEEAEYLGWDQGATPNHLRSRFDDFCDSTEFGMRKPEPRFYLEACRRNDVKPEDAVFLDDIGENLKTAQDLGMRTIRVRIGETMKAVKALEEVVGLDLTTVEDVQSKL